MCKLQTCCKQ